MNGIMAPFHWLLASFFEFSINLTQSPGLSLIFLSIFVTVLLAPVQMFISWIKNKNAATKEAMREVEEEIERCYSGQTRYLYLKTLYRQHHYNPVNNFISLSIPLIQIPFFFAAYNYLSAYTWPTSDLSQPDGIIRIGELSINLLPILMTIANLLTIEFTTDEKKSEKTMLRYLALIFFVFLYSMPSALVIYWMMNNILLLVANVIRVKKAVRVREVTSTLLSYFSFFSKIRLYPRETIFSLLMLGLYTGLLSYLNPYKDSLSYMLTTKATWMMAILGGLGLMSGVWKRPKVIRETPTEFKTVLYCFMFATFPVIHYAYLNATFLNLRYLLEIILYLILPCYLLLLLLKGTFSRFFKNDYYIVFTSCLMLTFFLTPIWLNLFKVRIEEGFLFQLFLLALISKLFIQMSYKNKKTFALISAVIFLVSLGRFSARVFRRVNSNVGLESKVKIPAHFPKKLAKKPDIYLLIYDAYIDERVMEHFGIKNSEQFRYLEKTGFKLYENKLTLEPFSLKSISYVFATERPKLDTRKVLVGNNPVDKFLKTQGYQSYYVGGDYYFKGEKEVAKGILLTGDEERNALLDGILLGEFKAELISKGANQEKWLKLKHKLFTQKDEKPKVVYMHSEVPGHTQDSGTCLENEVELYSERLARANREMREDIQNILQTNPNSIIVVAGDHGVYFTGDCTTMRGWENRITGEHIVDRYGVFIGIRWPDNSFEDFDQFDYLQEIFPVIFAYLTQDKKILEHSPKGEICLRGTCASAVSPISAGPDQGKILFDSF